MSYAEALWNEGYEQGRESMKPVVESIKQAANDACQSVYEEWVAGTQFENMPLAIAARMVLAWHAIEKETNR